MSVRRPANGVLDDRLALEPSERDRLDTKRIAGRDPFDLGTLTPSDGPSAGPRRQLQRPDGPTAAIPKISWPPPLDHTVQRLRSIGFTHSRHGDHHSHP